MPTLNSAKVGATLAFDLSTLVDIGEASHEASWSPSYVFSDGLGANQAKAVFADERTLAASANESLDLAGGLSDVFGNLITFTKIKAIAIQAAATNSNDVLVGGAASNGFISFVGATDDTIKVKPGGMFLIVAPDANGLAVTASTADLLKIANSAGGSSVTYKIVIIGVA
ncbi:hypothetical protein [Sphingobium mellinum]|uniref:hypothetical protein n=1 Tax=Sphingobium mellinum TaxID=1387166 RepID=UPI0030EB2F4D